MVGAGEHCHVIEHTVDGAGWRRGIPSSRRSAQRVDGSHVDRVAATGQEGDGAARELSRRAELGLSDGVALEMF